jgi:hypothetical protein
MRPLHWLSLSCLFLAGCAPGPDSGRNETVLLPGNVHETWRDGAAVDGLKVGIAIPERPSGPGVPYALRLINVDRKQTLFLHEYPVFFAPQSLVVTGADGKPLPEFGVRPAIHPAAQRSASLGGRFSVHQFGDKTVVTLPPGTYKIKWRYELPPAPKRPAIKSTLGEDLPVRDWSGAAETPAVTVTVPAGPGER